MSEMILWCHQYDNGIGKYSYGVGYPICTIKDDEFIQKKFVGDQDDAFYSCIVSNKIQMRLQKI